MVDSSSIDDEYTNLIRENSCVLKRLWVLVNGSSWENKY